MSIPARILRTPPGPLVAVTEDGREVWFRRLFLERKPHLVGMPILLSDLRERDGQTWAWKVVFDEARAQEFADLVAAHAARTVTPVERCRGEVVDVDGDLGLVRLEDGSEHWFLLRRCPGYRGHLGIHVDVVTQPRSLKAITVAPEDAERNAALVKALEPGALGAITPPGTTTKDG